MTPREESNAVVTIEQDTYQDQMKICHLQREPTYSFQEPLPFNDANYDPDDDPKDGRTLKVTYPRTTLRTWYLGEQRI
jgi:hypothetical protein